MTDEPEPWQTSAPGPYMTIHPGGPLEGIVTLTAIAEGHGRSTVEASWVREGQRHCASVEVDWFEHARRLAYSIADELAAGMPPDLSRD